MATLPLPAFVEGRYFDILTANALATALSPRLVAGRNRLRDVFLDFAEQSLYPNWDNVTAGLVVSPPDLDRAASRYGLLLATAPTQVLPHGDLHLGNVLDGGPARGLVAIDPRACVGDPCFDAVDYALDGAGRDGVGNRCATLAPAAGLDPDRLYAWSCAIAPIIAINRIGQPGEQRAVAELLTLAR